MSGGARRVKFRNTILKIIYHRPGLLDYLELNVLRCDAPLFLGEAVGHDDLQNVVARQKVCAQLHSVTVDGRFGTLTFYVERLFLTLEDELAVVENARLQKDFALLNG